MVVLVTPEQVIPNDDFLSQVQVLSERLHFELQLRLVGLGEMGAGNRLDGAQWHQPRFGFQRAGGGLEDGLFGPWAHQG